MDIKNIYCVGRNYKLHAQELNNAVPTSPFLFSKPTHALASAEGQALLLPAGRGAVHYEVELVVHIGRSYEAGMNPDELIDKVAIGIDFTLRDVQDELKKKGLPWLSAKGFPNSALLSPWLPYAGIQELKKHDFTLSKNDCEVQRGNIQNMLFDLPTILEFTAQHFGLGAGDILFTGTPAGVGAVEEGDHLMLGWLEKQVGDVYIRLR